MPLEENIISWNVTNWITVCVMVLLMYAGLGFLQTWWTNRQAAA